jgi:CO/xanthine dehydrogenase FAD-binding subunit
VTAVVLPDDMPESQHFAKIGVRSAMVISTVSCVVTRGTDGFRVALGSVAPTVIRLPRAEEMLNSEGNPSETALDEFAVTVSQEVRPITDHRSTEAYRRHAAGVLARRLVVRCLK